MQECFQRKPLLGEALGVLPDELEIGTTGTAEKSRDPGYMVSQVVFQVGQYLRIRRVGISQNLFKHRLLERLANRIRAVIQRRCDSRDYPMGPQRIYRGL
jgi:hypothetical protein